MFPGYGEKPELSATSPPVGVPFSSGSSWLYSTLIVNEVLSFATSLAIPPHASPGHLGTVTEFILKPSLTETPRRLQSERKGSGFVSWKKRTCVWPASSHFFAKPVVCSKVWTSP